MKGCWEAVGRSKNADLRKGRQKVDSPQTNKNLNSALLMSVSFKQETTIKIQYAINYSQQQHKNDGKVCTYNIGGKNK